MTEKSTQDKLGVVFSEFERSFFDVDLKRTPVATELIKKIIKELKNIFEIAPDKGVDLAVDLASKYHKYQYEYQLQELMLDLINIRNNLKENTERIEPLSLCLSLPQIGIGTSTGNILTPANLSIFITPYLCHIENLQSILDSISGRSSRAVRIRLISQNSPVSINLEGANEALETIRDSIIPWRRKHAKDLAKLYERHVIADIELKNAEVAEKRAQAAKTDAESSKLLAEAEERRINVQKLRLENAKLEIELKKEKVKLAMDIIDKYYPNVSEQEKFECLTKILPSLEYFVTTDIAMDSK